MRSGRLTFWWLIVGHTEIGNDVETLGETPERMGVDETEGGGGRKLSEKHPQ